MSNLIVLVFTLYKYLPRGKGFIARAFSKILNHNGDYFMKLSSGAELNINMKSLDEYAYVHSNNGTVDTMILLLLKKLMPRKGVFYDIGANIGSLGIDIAMTYKDEIIVYLFEPQSDLCKSIVKSINKNKFKNVKIIDYLLGNADGNNDFFISKESTKSSIIPRSISDAIINLNMRKIDSIIDIDLNCNYPSIVKIDVEGAEFDVLKGSEAVIRKSMPVLIFECDINALRFGYTTPQLINYLISLGYNEVYGWQFGVSQLISVLDFDLKVQSGVINDLNLDNFIAFNSGGPISSVLINDLTF